MFQPDCVPAFKAGAPGPNVPIHRLCDGSGPATHSGRDDHELLADSQTPQPMRSTGANPSPCAVDGHDCFRLVGAATEPLTKEQELLFELVRLGWWWKEPGVLARPWNKKVPSFMNPEGR